MKLKQKPNDFRVRELLKDDYLTEKGTHHVYHITKRKLTSIEAAEILAEMANVPVGEIAMAGLKDRQGVTEQYMSFSGGKQVELNTPELKIARAGVAETALSSENSYGNAFEIRLRDLDPVEFRRLAAHKDVVGRLGVPNYFDEQRFGNLRHGQGWIAKDLMLGQHEKALRSLLCAESEFDSGKIGAFKHELREVWGDWSSCREVAGKFGEHHSIFDHLRKEPTDFAGAFYHVSSRLRLIHLYAFQSHIWNRAVAKYFAKISGDGGARIGVTIEGPQVFPDRKLDVDLEWGGAFRLPGEGLEDVEHANQRELLVEALAEEDLTPEQFRIAGVSGFQLKGEDRRLFIRPRHLKIENGRAREGNEGTARLNFELPRGAYATLVIRGLLARFQKGSIDLNNMDFFREDPRRSAPRQQGHARRFGNDRGQGSREPRRWGGDRRDERQGGGYGRRDDGGRREGGWQGNREGGRSSYGRSDDRGPRQGGYGGNREGGGSSYGGGGDRGPRQGGYGGNREGGRPSYGGGGGDRGPRQGGYGGNREGGGSSYGGGGDRGPRQGGYGGNRDGGRPSYGGGGDRGPRQGGYGGNRDGGRPSYGGGGDRGPRQGGYGGNREGGGSSYGGGGDRGPRQGGYGGNRDGGRPGYGGGGDRGPRQGGYGGNREGGRPSYGGGGDRGPRQGGYGGNREGGRPSYGGGGDRGPRQGGYGGNREGGGSSYGGGGDRGPRQGGYGGNREGGRPSYGGGGDRGPRQGGYGGNRDGGRPSYGGGGDRGPRQGGYGGNRDGGRPSYGGGGDRGPRQGGYGGNREGGGSSYGGGGDRGPRQGGYGGNREGGRPSYGGGGDSGRRQGGYGGNRDGGGSSYGGGNRDRRDEAPRSKKWDGANVPPPSFDPRDSRKPGPPKSDSKDGGQES